MKRRNFLSGLLAVGARPVLGRESTARIPATLDLREPMRRAVACVLNRMDPAQNYRPWFAVDVVDGVPTKLRHDVWDFGDTSGRFLEALILARQMVPPGGDALLAERRIRRFVDSLFGVDGLIANPERHEPDHMFSQGSALYGLVTDFDSSRDPKLEARIQSFIEALNRAAVQERDYLWFPQVATKIAPCSHMAAYQVLPIVRFYELTHYAPALKYSERLARWAFYHDPTVTVEGVITKTGWEGHLHAWMDTYTGIIRCTLAGGDLDRDAVLARARKLYEWVKANYTSSFGWVADSVGSQTCETDTITSAIRLALELIKQGHHEYWNDIERFARNQLVENQFVDVSRLGIRDPRTSRGLQGAFESYAAPNTLLAARDAVVEGCCINGGMRGLFLAYDHAVHATPTEVRVNLLLTSGGRGVEVTSFLPFEGRLDLTPQDSRPLFVRYPDWLSREDVRIEAPSRVRHEPESGAPYLKFSGHRRGSRIVLRFPQREVERTEVVAGKPYRVRWRGDTVAELLPAGAPYPIFQRSSLRGTDAPLKVQGTPFRVSRVHW
ncbi:MAG: hypothetical protein ACE145_16715 [Terriglobia bacterium]